MSFLSNFDGVTMSDATHMRVTGRSDRGSEVTQLLIAIAALPVGADEAGLGAPMIDDSAVLEASLDGPFEFAWTFNLTCEPGRFRPGRQVLLAGSAVRREGPPDVWLNTMKIIDG